MNNDSIAIEAATDGACSGNPGPGGWGGLIIFDDNSELEIGGSEQNTTNNRMELTAAIKTLEKLKTYKLKENFKLKTDSKYVIEGYTKWIINWKRNGWKTSTGKSVQNLDLWQKIDQLRIDGLIMEFVKGHSGDKQNDRVDKIATNYSKGISIVIKSQEEESSVDLFETNGPADIQKLLSRNELMQKFAEKKYLLSSLELSDLLCKENELKIKKYLLFEWRNWRFIPKDKKYWIIEKKEF
ncbi:ribonuclease HI [Prochlorococcus marinus str. MU1404]|uniref:ribonuclease H family protein n=1 Tax=Prochlorococcus marinus TaxID=1219 RepID=UPI001ADBDB00|nr:ribonuclease H [Prochlorococcus marinus]MBO8229371.1 ribonuclease HI [Prochlorococcus marinus XMU1404]MBW3072454.1 ribonuclease HI [Prochlorococcus marinus str. MU1404]MCR8544445.1 ribonuclease HI [Prochlorococcus marinus CUG1432]